MKGQIDYFIDRSFRDVADTDYVAARICWRQGLELQFLWMALQAVEKYLKAILLYSRQPVHDLSHDISKALVRVEKIPVLDFKLEPQLTDFLEWLNVHGANRYFEWNLKLDGCELLLLDKCVWNIRMRCVALDSYAKVGDELIWTTGDHFNRIKACKTSNGRKAIVIPFGELERILGSASEARTTLVWKNFYFGRYSKRSIKWKTTSLFASPNHVCHPEILGELNKLVKFSQKFQKFVRSASTSGN